MLPNNGISINRVLIAKLLNNSLAYGFSINLDIVRLYTSHSGENTIFYLLLFENFGFIYF